MKSRCMCVCMLCVCIRIGILLGKGDDTICSNMEVWDYERVTLSQTIIVCEWVREWIARQG